MPQKARGATAWDFFAQSKALNALIIFGKFNPS